MPILGSKGGGSAGGYGLAGASVPQYINATGGTITEDGDYRIHTFTGPGSFVVKSAKEPTYANVDYFVVAGGGGTAGGGGGGAGGFRESYNPTTSGPYTASPLASPTSLPVSKQSYPITVGAGGNPAPGESNGTNSVFSSITSNGGGKGGLGFPNVPTPGGSGGSGGGVGRDGSGIPAGAGNTPPTSPSQGNPGGTSSAAQYSGSGGGGGAASNGGNGGGGTSGGIEFGGPGGPGHGTQINPSPSVGTPGPSAPLRYYGGGGSGYTDGNTSGTAGYGGGGQGYGPQTPVSTSGTANTGGGGGGQDNSGGSGIVIIRYKFK